MGLSFTSFIVKILTLSLLITSYAEHKLFSEICPKTNYRDRCYDILQRNRTTKRASSLHSLALSCLGLAGFQARRSVEILNFTLKMRKRIISARETYEDCRDNYKVAVKKILEACDKLKRYDYASARMATEVASKVPISCQRAFGRQPAAVAKINDSADVHFNIALVSVAELLNKGRKKYSISLYHKFRNNHL